MIRLRLRRSCGCFIAGFVLLALSGCAHARANTTPEVPGLDVPAPPPRVVEPTEAEPPEPVPLVKEPAHHAPAQTPRQNRPAEPTRSEAPKNEPTKPEPPPPEAPKVEEPHPAPPPTLQTTAPQAEGEVERTIRTLLTRAQSDLNRVDYRALNSDARGQYDLAKGYIRQAEQALRGKNLVFARAVADKAAVLAAQLAGR
jgi:hypothetical protein